MELKERILCVYSQEGHGDYPQDTWSDTSQVSGVDSLFYNFKDLHKQSARTFSDYPFGGLFDPRKVRFEIQKTIVHENETFYGARTTCEPPEYYNDACKLYWDWVSKLKERLPKLRKAASERIQREKELKQLGSLLEKYPKHI